MAIATATEVQNNFGKYLQMAREGGEVIVLKNGKEVARLISHEKSVSFLTDSWLFLFPILCILCGRNLMERK